MSATWSHEGGFEVAQQGFPLLDSILRGVLLFGAHDALALEAPVLQLLLSLVVALGVGDLVPEGQLPVGWNISHGTDDLHVAEEAASDVAVAAVVDVRCLDPDATRVVILPLLLVVWRTLAQVGTEGGQREAEGIQGNDPIDEKPVYDNAWLILIKNISRETCKVITYVSTTGTSSTQVTWAGM